jgi:hypothetical protein
MENRPKIHKLHVVFLMCVLTMLMGKAHATSQVQQASNYDISGNIYSSFTATFNSATTAGDAIIVGITYGNTNPTISATDTRGDTFVLAVKTWDFRHNQGSAILYATAINGGSANTVTVNFGNSVAYLGMGIHEYSGLASSSALDIAVGKLGSGSNPTAGSTTSTANGDLIFSCGVEDAIGHGDTFTAGPGFSKSIDLGQTAAYADEDTVQVSAGAFTAGWTLSPRSDWIVTMAAFKGAGDGSGTTGGGTTGPQISSLSPTSGSVGTAVTITGTNFGSTQGTSTVTFNGTAAAATNWSSTKIVAPVPSGATTGNVVVTVAGQDSNGQSFTVTPTNSGNGQVTLNNVQLLILSNQSGIPQPIKSTVGNLIVVSYIGAPATTLNAVRDNQGNQYMSVGTSGDGNLGGESFIFYAPNAKPGVTSITLTMVGQNQTNDAVVYDISGAASQPLDNATSLSFQDEPNFGPFSGPSIRANTSGGIIIANVGIDSNNITGVESPWTFDPQDENNGWAHVLNAPAGTYTPTWTTDQSEQPGGVNQWGAIAAAFMAAPK